ncbi:Spy/CpxP family protein refolding chaperone [Maridesulfovibrio sp. FT414]|uniref:Spy/CpxP family protein refolding chaperone n=1 Tax=Maridesulfovibrio sp. FT414 TaxID=2979469 RepID=UPI003D802871
MIRKALVPMIVVLILTVASVAMARNGYRNAGYHDGNWAAYNQLTPEKQQQVQNIVKKYEATFQALGSQQWAKRTELNALVDSGKADKESIQALVKELSDIRDKVYAEHKKMAEELEKETGISFPSMGQGSGRGCGNYRQGGCPGGGGNCGNVQPNCPGGNCPGQGS